MWILILISFSWITITQLIQLHYFITHLKNAWKCPVTGFLFCEGALQQLVTNLIFFKYCCYFIGPQMAGHLPNKTQLKTPKLENYLPKQCVAARWRCSTQHSACVEAALGTQSSYRVWVHVGDKVAAVGGLCVERLPVNVWAWTNVNEGEKEPNNPQHGRKKGSHFFPFLCNNWHFCLCTSTCARWSQLTRGVSPGGTWLTGGG